MAGRVSVEPKKQTEGGPRFRLRVKASEEEVKQRMVAALTALLAGEGAR
jgi:hypothetical protein